MVSANHLQLLIGYIDRNMPPYRMQIRHQPLLRDYARQMQSVRWLCLHCERNLDFPRPFVIGDETAFAMHGQVCSHNVKEYAATLAGKPSEFNYEININCEILTVWI